MDGADKLAAPCSMYCGVCGLYRAYKTNDQKLKEKLGNLYGIEPKDIICEGCLSNVLIGFCSACAIRNCAIEKNLAGCFECGDFPCDHVENFPFEPTKNFMKSGAKKRRDVGTEKWIEWEMARFTCKECGSVAIRGARRCPDCKAELEVEQ
jgi:hypothetical protein